MTQVRICIGLPNQVRHVNPTVIPRWAVQAEEAGFSTLGTVGRHAYPGIADTVALAAAAGATSRIKSSSPLRPTTRTMSSGSPRSCSERND
jgi:alkanesulfonate monooxygenase SsuD/methylene tetrahydromethanopterin reductase-like flavin-dependent oxidoreductase (luciferase family)